MRRLAVLLCSFALTLIPSADPPDVSYYSLHVPAGLTIQDLIRDGYDIDHAATVVATPTEVRRLRARGVVLEKTGEVYQPVPRTEPSEATYYGGYHTTKSHEEHNAAVAAAHPDLVKLYDIGDSWKKTQGQGGHDIQALCITKLAPGDCALNSTGKKPKFVLHAQIHAREIATGEIAYRWIDLLVSSYGVDPEITALLNTRELWVVPIANPDGVDVVASNPTRPVLQRKNVDDDGHACPAPSAGVDLNRNSSFHWDVAQGGPCAETYPGAKALSEPETAAVQGLLDTIFPDTKGGLDDPAAASTTGLFLTLHSYGNDILAPWGYTREAAPDRAALVALGNKMSAFTGYPVATGDGGIGYFTPGSTSDWLYGTRGVPAYTFEIGPRTGWCAGFLPAYSCVSSTFWPLLKPALVYAARAAAAPYGQLP
ncbi:M14 family zinc carboxypeptidase [Kribbella sp. C-35]|uniref:M14 family zinc carboxypeptidase n=1 Tax=Kribbella sp. C-35 TaxID=2789276 RepID=UPI00397BDFC7